MPYTGLGTKVYKDPLTIQWMNSIKDNFDEHHTGVAKAWINFDGTLASVTARVAFNFSNVIDSGAGSYSLVFTTGITSTAYVILGTLSMQSGGSNVMGLCVETGDSPADTGSFKITTRQGTTHTDSDRIMIAVIGAKK